MNTNDHRSLRVNQFKDLPAKEWLIALNRRTAFLTSGSLTCKFFCTGRVHELLLENNLSLQKSQDLFARQSSNTACDFC